MNFQTFQYRCWLENTRTTIYPTSAFSMAIFQFNTLTLCAQIEYFCVLIIFIQIDCIQIFALYLSLKCNAAVNLYAPLCLVWVNWFRKTNALTFHIRLNLFMKCKLYNIKLIASSAALFTIPTFRNWERKGKNHNNNINHCYHISHRLFNDNN